MNFTFRQCLDGVFVTTPSRKFLVERLHTCFATAGPGKDKTLFVHTCTNSDFSRAVPLPRAARTAKPSRGCFFGNLRIWRMLKTSKPSGGASVRSARFEMSFGYAVCLRPNEKGPEADPCYVGILDLRRETPLREWIKNNGTHGFETDAAMLFQGWWRSSHRYSAPSSRTAVWHESLAGTPGLGAPCSGLWGRIKNVCISN